MKYIEYFKKIEDLLNVAKMIEITDIVREFKFGFEKSALEYEYPIRVGTFNGHQINYGNYQGDKEKILDWFKYFWKPSLHFERGICYTFDGIAIKLNSTGKGVIATNAKDTMSRSMYRGNMLTLGLYFNVSFNSNTSLNSQFIIELKNHFIITVFKGS